jgi:hypothetical protein
MKKKNKNSKNIKNLLVAVSTESSAAHIILMMEVIHMIWVEHDIHEIYMLAVYQMEYMLVYMDYLLVKINYMKVIA